MSEKIYLRISPKEFAEKHKLKFYHPKDEDRKKAIVTTRKWPKNLIHVPDLTAENEDSSFYAEFWHDGTLLHVYNSVKNRICSLVSRAIINQPEKTWLHSDILVMHFHDDPTPNPLPFPAERVKTIVYYKPKE